MSREIVLPPFVWRCQSSSGRPAVLAAAPTPDAPDAVLNAVKNGPHAKIGPWLSNLYAEYQEAAGKGVTAKAFKTKNQARCASRKGLVGIDAYANDAAALTRSLKSLGATKIKARGPLVSAQVPVEGARPDRGAGIAAVRATVLATAMHCRRRRSRRATCRLTVRRRVPRTASMASGVTVGTLSDSYDCNPPPFQPGAPNTTFAEDIANDELPTDTTILDNGPCAGAIDEGRGMAQLIHDVAPGAAIAFHTAFNSELDFAEASSSSPTQART